MHHTFARLLSVVPALVAIVAAARAEEPERAPLDLTNLDAVRAKRPILVAHRGGVVTANSPECSLTAIRLAAKAGYHLVELDVRPSQDEVPVVFHDRMLSKATGKPGTPGDYTAAEITKVRYLQVEETIATLDEAMGLCKSLGLGVMLDVKDAGSALMLKRAADLVRQHQLQRSTITLNSDPRTAAALADVSLVNLKSREKVPRPGLPGRPLHGYFLQELPKDVPIDDLPRLQREGVLVLAAINTFRYPTEGHEKLAAEDIRRLLAAGVDGFQIDSVYQGQFGISDETK